MKAYVDIDGVILNLSEGIRLELEKKGKTFYPHKVKEYNFSCDVGCSQDDVFKVLNSVEVYKSSPLYRMALEGLAKLKTFADVEAYTCVIQDEIIVAERKDLLYRLGLKGFVYPYTRTSNKPVPKDADVIFEDCLENCKYLFENGYEGVIYLVEQPYNRNIGILDSSSMRSRIIRGKNFYDCVEKFIYSTVMK